MHRFFREANVSRLQAQQFCPEHLPEMAMSPHDAARCLVRNDVGLSAHRRHLGPHRHNALRGLSAGHCTIVPGERLTERAQP